MGFKVCIIAQDGSSEPPRVEAQLPEEFSAKWENGWTRPFDVSVDSKFSGFVQMASSAVMKGSGVAPVFDLESLAESTGMTTVTYTGTEPITIDLMLEFVVETSLQNDLIDPIRKLMAMCSPDNLGNSFLLTPPVDLTVSIDGLLYARKAVCRAIGIDFIKPLLYDKNADKVGVSRARIPFSFETKYVMKSSEIEGMFF